MDHQDSINQTTFSDAGSFNWLSSLEGFIDDGERVVYLALADEIRDQAILDLGVGTGRTVPLLTALSTNYVAIDYLPIMVSAARRKFPGTNIQVGDARDLSRFNSETFSVVVFSHAGIDSIDHEGRQQALREAHRVLKPNGIFWFSTLNKDGEGPHERPWQKYRMQAHHSHTLRARLSATRELFEGYYNYRRLKSLAREGDGWLIAPFAAHAFGLVTHYITLDEQRDELTRAGFLSDIKALDARGILLGEHSDLRKVDFFNIVARKAPAKAQIIALQAADCSGKNNI